MGLLLLGLIWLAVGGALVHRTLVCLSRGRARSVARVLAILMRHNLPLVEGLRSAARTESRVVARVLRRLADRLALGDAISTGLRRAWWHCPSDLMGAIQAGERGGTLPSVLAGLEEQVARFDKPMATAAAVGYSAVMLLITTGIALSVTLNLVPQFYLIFLDFGVHRLPTSTQWLVGASAFMREYAFGLAIGLLVVLQVVLVRQFLQRVPDRTQPLAIVGDTLLWITPGARQIASNRALARQLPVIVVALRAGHDLPAAVQQAVCLDANWHARRRLRRFGEYLASQSPAAAAKSAGLPNAVRTRLAQSGNQADFLAGLEYLGRYYRSLETHWEHVVGTALLPLVTVGWGLLIGFVVVALYLPMTRLTEGLLDQIY